MVTVLCNRLGSRTDYNNVYMMTSHLHAFSLSHTHTVCIGMIWDSDQPNVDDIMSVVETVGTIVRVSDVRLLAFNIHQDSIMLTLCC